MPILNPMTAYYIEILLNETEDATGRKAIFTRFGDEDRYQEGDDLKSVWSGEVFTEETEDVLELAFEMFNRGAPRFIGDEKYPHRSLSVGDCVRVDEVDLYVCEPAGWKKVA